MHYVGVEFETGEEFDASWNRGSSINFPLGSLILWIDRHIAQSGGQFMVVADENGGVGEVGVGRWFGGDQ